MKGDSRKQLCQNQFVTRYRINNQIHWGELIIVYSFLNGENEQIFTNKSLWSLLKSILLLCNLNF